MTSLSSSSVQEKVPRHVAIIMDGNGRWAQKRCKSRVFGHQEGVKRLQDILEVAKEKEIEVISLFAFSSENWKRPKEEVKQLLKLFSRFLQTEIKKLQEHNIRLRIIGDLTAFPKKLQQQMQQAMDESKSNAGLQLVIAANYGGKWDILQAVQRIVCDVEEQKLSKNEIDESMFSSYLSMAELPDPDLFIRTSGEIRLSNFFLWQQAYTELYFTDILWPDFNRAAFKEALAVFAKRSRRFGLTTEQIEREPCLSND